IRAFLPDAANWWRHLAARPRARLRGVAADRGGQGPAQLPERSARAGEDGSAAGGAGGSRLEGTAAGLASIRPWKCTPPLSRGIRTRNRTESRRIRCAGSVSCASPYSSLVSSSWLRQSFPSLSSYGQPSILLSADS